MSKPKKINVQGAAITIIQKGKVDYISLTDMVRSMPDGLALIEKWLRNKNTIEFLGIWEKINNPAFNSPEFEGIMMEAGLNRFTISVKKWVTITNAIGLFAKTGRYHSGTYAQKDIAFEFGAWLSPEFKLYLIKEFQRLKDEESQRSQLEWNVSRTLAKVNYRIHTDAIKANLIPLQLSTQQIQLVYASEADLLNMALFGKTAAQWRKENPAKEGNIRDYATLEQLVVLANLESMNALFIQQALSPSKRLGMLNQQAIQQMKSLLASPSLRKLK